MADTFGERCDMPDRNCPWCGDPMTSRQKRSCADDECRRLAKNQAQQQRWSRRDPSAIPPCSQPGCTEPQRAKGLCSTHYNQQWDGVRHPTMTVTCSWCGVPCERQPHRVRDNDHFYHSDECKAAHYSATRTTKALVHVGPPTYQHIPAGHPARQPAPAPAPGVFVAGQCRRCRTPFLVLIFHPDSGASYCSHRCARADSRDRRRATKKQAYREDVRRADVFDRDGWRCQLCRRLVPKVYRHPHLGRRYTDRRIPDLAPVIDHIIPLATGGEHSMANAQTSHFICNSIKSAGIFGEGDQLRLVG